MHSFSETPLIYISKNFNISNNENEQFNSDLKDNISPPIPPPFPLALLNPNNIPLLKERAKTVRIGELKLLS